MGLDMHLKSISQRHWQILKTQAAQRAEYVKWNCNLWESAEYARLNQLIQEALKDGCSSYSQYSKLTKEDRNLIARFKAECIRKAHSLGGILCRDGTYVSLSFVGEAIHTSEIGYWSKEWPLHHFVIQNFGDPDNDNMTEVSLDEAAILKVIEKYKDKEEYIGPFRTALDIVRGGSVVFYWAWY